jgi:hypothetical protein
MPKGLEVRMIEPPTTASTTLFKGGPTLIDLLLDVTELRITVTGPRMLFERLELVTTLSALDGCTVQQLRKLAGCLEGTIHCGLVGVQHAHIQVETLRSGGSLQVDLGPPSMYQSELVLRTRTGETFRALLRRPFVAGLHAVTASGHLEHGHAGTPGDGGHQHAMHAGGAEHGRP